ncbi:MAG: hypothetical protein ACFE7E_03805 [Candidatus Hodarchaeota archaeon]
MAKSRRKQFEIKLEVIKTPKGEVPTVGSLRQVVAGLNELNTDIAGVRSQIMEEMKDLRRDMSAIKKLLAEETVTFDAINEKFIALNKGLESLLKQKTDDKTLKAIKELETAVKALETQLSELTESVTGEVTKQAKNVANAVGKLYLFLEKTEEGKKKKSTS